MGDNTNVCSGSTSGNRMENSIINSTTTSFSKMKINDGERSPTITTTTFRDIQLKHLERERKEFFTKYNQISTNSNISKPFHIIPTFSTIKIEKNELDPGYVENQTRTQSPMDISDDETSIVISCVDIKKNSFSSSPSLSDGAASYFRIPIPIKHRMKNISNLKINNTLRRCNKVDSFSRLQSRHFKNAYREFMENDIGMIFINSDQKQRSLIRIQHEIKGGEISVEGTFLREGKTDTSYNSNNNDDGNNNFKSPKYPLERHIMKISISKSQFHFISDMVIKKSHSDEFDLRIPTDKKNIFNKKVGGDVVEYVDVDNYDTVYSLTKPPAFSF
uniref:Uncharacterized protein n=1 Tax=Armadillidium vulgare clopovirus TaxID=2984284 RepID=A0A9C7F7F1_9VIRU|nr:MAG: hypothetical protein [Armadillidium vulgare clopovirus]